MCITRCCEDNLTTGWCVTEPVMGGDESEKDDGDSECHQMVMAWTLESWKVTHFNCDNRSSFSCVFFCNGT